MSEPQGDAWKLPGSRVPTERERQQLCRMLYFALLEMRALGRDGRAQQAGDLADAFHNLPAYLWSDAFSFSFFRKFLESYQQAYPDRPLHFDYLRMLDEITGESV